MKKKAIILTVLAALALSLAACGKARAAENQTPGTEVQFTADIQPAAQPGRQNGERFEEVILMEGMEETVRYEHIRNEALGFEMDYDYESLVRCSDAQSERFVSAWDDPKDPENYLEVKADTGSADLVADAIRVTLSDEYDVSLAEWNLEHAGRCIRIEASVLRNTNQPAKKLQTVYVIPAADGCRVATAHCSLEAAEGFGRRFAALMDTLTVFDRTRGTGLTDDQALSAIVKYCTAVNPELQSIVDSGEYPAYWNLASSDAQEIVVLFRSYTGAQVRYYIDRASGETYITEFVPGITPEETRTGESLNAFDYLG